MALKKCSGCGAQFEGDVKFCAKCGAKLEYIDVDTVVAGGHEADDVNVPQQQNEGAEHVVPPVISGGKTQGATGGKPRGRVIKCDAKTVTLGMDDGTVREIPTADFGFKVKLNDEVDIFANNGKTIYAKVEQKPDVIVVESNKKPNKWIYLLLALFLGTAGIHNFYSGNTIIGIIWLIIFGICFLLNLTGIGAVIGLPVFALLEFIAVVQGIIGLFRY